MKTCPDCGERVYKLGCVNCNEAAYIEQQNMFVAQAEDEAKRAIKRERAEEIRWAGYPLTWGDE
jgi:hypothetical protein